MVEGPSLPLYARYVFAAVVVIWVSLAGGAWVGRAIVTSAVLGEKDDQVEFRSMPEPRARPWVKVDPEIQAEIDSLRESIGSTSVPAEVQKGVASTPSVSSTPAGLKTTTPSVLATPVVGAATPTQGKVVLQFGSFADSSNAQRLCDQLKAQGQQATVEEVESKVGTLYRVKGLGFDSSQEAERVARELRLQGFQVLVVGD